MARLVRCLPFDFYDDPIILILGSQLTCMFIISFLFVSDHCIKGAHSICTQIQSVSNFICSTTDLMLKILSISFHEVRSESPTGNFSSVSNSSQLYIGTQI